jgi:hypothetical protein
MFRMSDRDLRFFHDFDFLFRDYVLFPVLMFYVRFKLFLSFVWSASLIGICSFLNIWFLSSGIMFYSVYWCCISRLSWYWICDIDDFWWHQFVATGKRKVGIVKVVVVNDGWYWWWWCLWGYTSMAPDIALLRRWLFRQNPSNVGSEFLSLFATDPEFLLPGWNSQWQYAKSAISVPEEKTQDQSKTKTGSRKRQQRGFSGTMPHSIMWTSVKAKSEEAKEGEERGTKEDRNKEEGRSREGTGDSESRGTVWACGLQEGDGKNWEGHKIENKPTVWSYLRLFPFLSENFIEWDLAVHKKCFFCEALIVADIIQTLKMTFWLDIWSYA